MNILLTGASGRIGSHTCRHLHEAGFAVRAVDRLPNPSLPVRLEVVNLLEREICYRLLDGMDAVVHLANHAAFQAGQVPQTVFNENVTMNMNVFQAACDMGVRKILFASSVQTFAVKNRLALPDRIPELPFPYLPLDGWIPARPVNPYGLSKQVSEEMLRYFVLTHGMAAVVLRFPRVLDEGIISRLRDRSAFPFDAVEEAFTYLHVHDAARLIESCLRADLAGYHPYLPSAQDIQVLAELPTLVATHFSGIPWRDGKAPSVLVDISAITRETGWTPSFNALRKAGSGSSRA